MTGKRIDPRLRAEFREKARTIIGRDRAARARGLSQNTIGEIERALVQSYLQGQDSSRQNEPLPRLANAGIDWEEVQVSGRLVLINLTHRVPGYTMKDSQGLQRQVVNGKERWFEIDAQGRPSDHSVAARSVNPLIRSGILAESSSGMVVLTPKGRATCEAYWRRRELNDPSLPKESLR